jgi:hypothetical protein
LKFQLASDTTWLNDTQTYTWPPKSYLTLRGLNSNTKYKIRAVVIEENGNVFLGNEKDTIPEFSFRTSCSSLNGLFII